MNEATPPQAPPSVLDGDTLEVLHSRHPERIRLRGIVCPEKGQAHGHQAKQATAAPRLDAPSPMCSCRGTNLKQELGK